MILSQIIIIEDWDIWKKELQLPQKFQGLVEILTDGQVWASILFDISGWNVIH